MIWVDWGIEASFWQRLGISPFGFSRLSTRGAKSFSQGNYAIGGVWHWFRPFRYRELLYNQFLSFLTFCCFLWVKNSIYHLGASQNIWLSEFHKFSKKCCCKRSVRKNRFGCTKCSRVGLSYFEILFFCAKIRALEPQHSQTPIMYAHWSYLCTQKKQLFATSGHVNAIEIETAILVYPGYCIDIAREWCWWPQTYYDDFFSTA